MAATQLHFPNERLERCEGLPLPLLPLLPLLLLLLELGEIAI